MGAQRKEALCLAPSFLPEKGDVKLGYHIRLSDHVHYF